MMISAFPLEPAAALARSAYKSAGGRNHLVYDKKGCGGFQRGKGVL
jgi:hypothetical protein